MLLVAISGLFLFIKFICKNAYIKFSIIYIFNIYKFIRVDVWRSKNLLSTIVVWANFLTYLLQTIFI